MIDTNYFAQFSYTKENMQECADCKEIMVGVYSKDIRYKCVNCDEKNKHE